MHPNSTTEPPSGNRGPADFTVCPRCSRSCLVCNGCLQPWAKCGGRCGTGGEFVCGECRGSGWVPAELTLSGVLLSDESLAALRRMAEKEPWPRRRLQVTYLDLCQTERAVHVAQVAGDAEAIAAADWNRTEARGRMRAECEQVADVYLSTLNHALEHKPAEVAEMMAKVFTSPVVRLALVPVFEAILRPTVAMLRGEIADLTARVADLEHALIGSEVLA